MHSTLLLFYYFQVHETFLDFIFVDDWLQKYFIFVSSIIKFLIAHIISVHSAEYDKGRGEGAGEEGVCLLLAGWVVSRTG